MRKFYKKSKEERLMMLKSEIGHVNRKIENEKKALNRFLLQTVFLVAVVIGYIFSNFDINGSVDLNNPTNLDWILGFMIFITPTLIILFGFLHRKKIDQLIKEKRKLSLMR